jgi:hypothetical protein
MCLNPIHQFALLLSVVGGVPLQYFEVGDEGVDVVGEFTLADIVGFVVSLRDIGEILLCSIVHPSAFETVLPSE